uniref:Uncharacterized protein n=1 Tax=Phocoena sinus TaxID=42100 RepID=A0A8C9BHS1_PHOSS
VSNIGYEWFNQGFILEVRKMAVTSKLLQSMSWACCFKTIQSIIGKEYFKNCF